MNTKPAVGRHSELINRIYKAAHNAIRKGQLNTCKWAQIGAKYKEIRQSLQQTQ